MRYAVIGDVHANLEALEAVLKDAEKQGCEGFVCLGDIVGYNADPAACTKMVRDLGCPVVRGNHDEDASTTSDLAELNPRAAKAMLWTRKNLSQEDRQWLGGLDLVRQVGDFTIVHATLDTPNEWGYVITKFDALVSFSFQSTPLCFHGHTHTPRFFVKDEDGSVEAISGDCIRLEKGYKYFINPGSVGQPRDGDWRASYGIYSTLTQEVRIIRLEYDLQRAQRKLMDAGL